MYLDSLGCNHSFPTPAEGGGGDVGCSRWVREGYGVGAWKAIKKGWEGIKSRFCFIVRNEKRIKF